MVDALLIGTLALVVAALLTGVVLGLWFRRARPSPAPPTASGVGSLQVVLDLEDADPDDPAVIRLVHESGVRALAASPDVEEVEVRARGGRLLGRADRRIRRPSRIAIPVHLFEPRVNGRRSPPLRHVRDEDRPVSASPRPVAVDDPRRRVVADRYELSTEIRALLADPDDPVDVVRAILEAGGREVSVAGDLLRIGACAIVVVPSHGSELASEDALNHAFRRIQESRAERGVVLSLGPLRMEDVRRREMLAPHVLHTGPDAIQRMADAVAVGADPLRFAVTPALAG